MRTLVLMFALALLAACPRGTTQTSGSAQPEPTPSRSTDHKDKGDAPRSTSTGPSAETAQRIVHAILVADAGAHAPIPQNLVVVQEDDRVLHVRGNPRALPQRGDVWRTAAVLGDESAAKKVVDMKVLFARIRAGEAELHGGIRLSSEAPDNATELLAAEGVTIVSTSEAGVEVKVLASRLDRLLGAVWVAQFEVSNP